MVKLISAWPSCQFCRVRKVFETRHEDNCCQPIEINYVCVLLMFVFYSCFIFLLKNFFSSSIRCAGKSENLEKTKQNIRLNSMWL